jgi:hypothetical protein
LKDFEPDDPRTSWPADEEDRRRLHGQVDEGNRTDVTKLLAYDPETAAAR